MRTPGRPISPTAHPRTRPEARDIAIKHRQENDWFRHDGKNVEPPPPGHVRLAGQHAGDIGNKYKGDSENWFQHNSKNPAPNRPPSRCPTAESVKCKEKVYGSEEKWYKMEENMNYHTPRHENRMSTVQGKEVYDKLAKADTMNWYRHEHGAGDKYAAPRAKSRTGPSKTSGDNIQKSRPSGTPDWYKTDRNPGDGDLVVQGAKPLRLKTADANEYQERNKHGTATNWFGHDSTVSPQKECHSPRITSPEAESISGKLKGESGNWFNHDANKDFADAKPNARGSAAAKDMLAKSRGGDMSKALQGNPSAGEPQRAAERIKPEAQDIAKKSIQGLMDKFLKQDDNRGYSSPHPGGRAVKPEAAEIAQKNKGVMGDCMGGYPGQATKKKPGRAVKSEASEIAQKNKGQVNNLLSNYGNHPQSARRPGRIVKAEASENAVRNKGQMGNLMNDYGKLQLSGRPAPRCKSQAAQENAVRGKGTMGGVISQQA